MKIKVLLLITILLLTACGKESTSGLSVRDMSDEQIYAWVTMGMDMADMYAVNSHGFAVTPRNTDLCVTYIGTGDFNSGTTSIIFSDCVFAGFAITAALSATWDITADPDVFTTTGYYGMSGSDGAGGSIDMEMSGIDIEVRRFNSGLYNLDLNFALVYEVEGARGAFTFDTTETLTKTAGTELSGKIRITDGNNYYVDITFIDDGTYQIE